MADLARRARQAPEVMISGEIAADGSASSSPMM